MFGRTSARRAKLDRSERVLEEARAAAAAARDALLGARDWAEPRWESARDWAAPRAAHAFHAGARRATPAVTWLGRQAERLTDAAHDAIVDTLIPSVIEATRRAGREDPPRKNRSTGKAILITLGVATVMGAALVAWAKRDPGDRPDEDGEEWEFLREQRAHAAHARTSINKAVENAEAALRHTADVVATATSAAAATVAEAVAPTARRVTTTLREDAIPAARRAASAVGDAAVPAARKVRDTARTLRSRAKSDVISAMDGVEDVWDDDATTDEVPKTPAPAAKPKTTKAKTTKAKTTPSSKPEGN